MFEFNVGLSVCGASVLFVLVIQTVPFAHCPLNVLCDPGQRRLCTDGQLGNILLYIPLCRALLKSSQSELTDLSLQVDIKDFGNSNMCASRHLSQPFYINLGFCLEI